MSSRVGYGDCESGGGGAGSGGGGVGGAGGAAEIARRAGWSAGAGGGVGTGRTPDSPRYVPPASRRTGSLHCSDPASCLSYICGRAPNVLSRARCTAARCYSPDSQRPGAASPPRPSRDARGARGAIPQRSASGSRRWRSL